MGAQSFRETAITTSAKQGFDNLCANATYEYGNDPYNGTINTCWIGEKRLSFDRPTDARRKQAHKFIEKELETLEKCVANYVDMGVVEYRVTTYKKVNDANTPKYKLGFVIKQEGRVVSKPFDTKTQAMDKMLEVSISKGIDNLYVAKEYALVEGMCKVGHIETEVKTYKSRPSLKPMPNRVVEEVHEYIFYGWASY